MRRILKETKLDCGLTVQLLGPDIGGNYSPEDANARPDAVNLTVDKDGEYCMEVVVGYAELLKALKDRS